MKTRQARDKKGQKLTKALEAKKWKRYRDTADQVFSKFIRDRDKRCFTCGGNNDHNGHFISRKVRMYRWNETNCHSQCYRCNVALNGNYIIYTNNMIKKYGQKKVDEMINNSYKIGRKPSIEDFEKIIIKYKQYLNEIQKKTLNIKKEIV